MLPTAGAVRFERHWRPPGQDWADSNDVNQQLLRVHIALFACFAASMQWIWPQLVLVACVHATYAHFSARLQPSILALLQCLLWGYLTFDNARYGTPWFAGVVTCIQMFITWTALVAKRIWYGLDMCYC